MEPWSATKDAMDEELQRQAGGLQNMKHWNIDTHINKL